MGGIKITTEDNIIDQEDRNEFLLTTKFPEEAKRLPFDYLNDYEKDIAQKCINKESLTEKEVTDLKKLLNDYRPFLKKYDAEKVEKNLDDNITIIKTSSELLKLINDPQRFRIDMMYTIGEKQVLLKLKIKQIADSDYLALLDLQTRVFRDLDDNERKVYAKAANNVAMTAEEQNMVKQIQDKINERVVDHERNAQDITEMLAKVADLVDDPEQTYEEKLQFWNQIDLSARILLFMKIKERFNISDKTEEELFPAIR